MDRVFVISMQGAYRFLSTGTLNEDSVDYDVPVPNLLVARSFVESGVYPGYFARKHQGTRSAR